MVYAKENSLKKFEIKTYFEVFIAGKLYAMFTYVLHSDYVLALPHIISMIM